MKKLLFACVAVIGLCALGQVADARPYGGDGYSHGRGYYGGRYGHYRHYGYYPYYGYGPRGIFFNTFFYPPPPVYFYPPPRPAYFEGRIESGPGRDYKAPARNDDYSK